MYVYLYDHFLKQKRYDSVIKAMETKLTDYGIAGKIIRLQTFTNAEAVIEDEIRKGAKTVVIVGNDGTFARVLSRAASCQVLYGFLPVGLENSIAEVLGITVNEPACDALARRRKMRRHRESQKGQERDPLAFARSIHRRPRRSLHHR